MANPPKRSWLSRFSPFRWFEAWLERMEQRQKDLLASSEALRLQIASSRAQAAELREEIERLQAETADFLAERSSSLPPSVVPSSSPMSSSSSRTAGRHCPRGHTAPPAARFCPECGHVFPTRSSG